ncbi:trans-1,2-dihydrobenzene-1,2-diol dehydrogenase [Misgurnus anguillicaudatus]|uniref:trans-1,2-dihydrobenzene-1,2-diol dehydrogenase n=1 Tax=Misgurnus anguillicaudatus TaxID=75329 RepID=UPI003CCF7162
MMPPSVSQPMYCPTHLEENGRSCFPLPKPRLPLNFMNSTGLRESNIISSCVCTGLKESSKMSSWMKPEDRCTWCRVSGSLWSLHLGN